MGYHIYQFVTTLAAKSLWRGLFSPIMWHEIIMAKYLRNKHVDEWLRAYQKGRKNISNIWDCCLNSMNAVFD